MPRAAATPTRRRHRRGLLALMVAGGLLASTTPASACPDCAAGIRARVRQGIFDAGFGPNLLAMIAPFAVFLGAAALVHSGRPR